jgi:hypothetical protein
MLICPQCNKQVGLIAQLREDNERLKNELKASSEVIIFLDKKLQEAVQKNEDLEEKYNG